MTGGLGGAARSTQFFPGLVRCPRPSHTLSTTAVRFVETPPVSRVKVAKHVH
jgi:hypothetical protein